MSPGESPPLVRRHENSEHAAVHYHGHAQDRARHLTDGGVRVAGRVGDQLRLARFDRTSHDASADRSPQPAPNGRCSGGGQDHGFRAVGRRPQQDEVVRRQHAQRDFEDALQGIDTGRG